MKNQTIEQAVVETSRHFCNGIALQLKPSNAVMEAIRLLNKELPKALQAQRDAGVEEERDNIIEIVKFTKFRDTQPQEPHHKYLQQAKGVDYIRNKILKALTPPTK